MLWRFSRRNALRYFLLISLAWEVLDVVLIHHRLSVASRNLPQQGKLHKPVRIYIASLHWNNEDILRDSWNHAVLDLVKALGPKNVFLSVHESGSWDDSKGALRELDEALEPLGVPRKITLDETTHADEILHPPALPSKGWIKTARGRIELRRIPYLSRLRNLSLKPLIELAKNGTTFDYVLFLNDVAFTVADVFALLNTNDGKYAAACSLDFSKPPKYYDTFALRDADGHEHATQTWPYFRSSKSRSAMKRSKPVPVSSCWNGMVIFPADVFAGEKALSFRGLDDSFSSSHLEGSECCLVHADNPASKELGVYVNPNVRVGYTKRAYQAVHPRGSWLSHGDIWAGLWSNRFRRWFTTPWFKERKVWILKRKWENEKPGREEKGWFCLINEMQVLVYNGWAHV